MTDSMCNPSRFTQQTLALLLLIMPLVAGCDLLGAGDEKELVTTGVLVANQGNFSDANGTITAYDPETGVATTVAENIGSIIQSIHLTGDRLYVAANTGDRVDVLDADSYERVGQIGGLASPRYLAEGPGGKAYVTNLFGEPGSFSGGKVTVIDRSTNARIKDVAVGNNPEGLAVAAGRLYVADNGFGNGRTVTVIETTGDTVAETIDVGCDGPRFVVADADEEVFVFCTGKTLYDADFNVVGETNGAVRVLNGRTGALVRQIDIEGRLGAAGPGQDAFHSPETHEIFVVKDANTILRFDTRTNQQTGQIGPFDGAPIGAVAYDHVEDRLYLGRVAGFTERGSVTIHDRTGAETGRFAAGIAPTYITFRHEAD